MSVIEMIVVFFWSLFRTQCAFAAENAPDDIFGM